LPLREEVTGSWLGWWLSKAGYRGPSAVTRFLAATAASTALGLLCVFLMNRLGIVGSMVEALAGIPGGAGDLLAFVATVGPYIVLIILTAVPTLVVRAARRNRIEAIEQDLAPALELLATLAGAGLSFDSALARIQESESGARPLSQEFRIYQRDVLAGIPRTLSLRRLTERIEVISVSIFVSALTQAEQAGASLSETLRTQADDLRDRRKLRALTLAQALPVKLVFPLIACFLPGIFYSTLGPVLNEFVDVMDAVINRR
jgi:tight adherence protein C